MQRYTPHIPTSLVRANPSINRNNVATGDGLLVNTYAELRKYIAELACVNQDVLLFFRGQKADVKFTKMENAKSTLYPTIYRNKPDQETVNFAWRKMVECGKLLAKRMKELKLEGYQIVERKRLIQWSILQHYEVTSTPLLDVSQSLRVACSFACLDNDTEYAYIYVLALPYYISRISANSEAEITSIRLISIAPPDALRPYYQEGFVVGEDEFDPVLPDERSELDFNRRLVYKFKIHISKQFWGRERPLRKDQLYPKGDAIAAICKDIINNPELYNALSLAKEMEINEELGKFVKVWSEIEDILRIANYENNKSQPFVPAYVNLKQIVQDKNIIDRFNEIRKIRNEIMHTSLSERMLPENLVEMAQRLLLDIERYLKLHTSKKRNNNYYEQSLLTL